ncbi:hypothetical protein P3W85_30085 [Cupriavidus basilensis]|uniref:Transposase n=1 Tax=Cupriavidus basilensis TaxID=68895 RepID=A0ABT6AXG0_9BURK|nr:hypothetical protein [Cupriavidus basilensis]MDF3837174.1 hypothetical protein [Cupriavidus basilensis]
MGNSKSAFGCQIPSPATGQKQGDARNGILASVRGDYVASALASLPAPTLDGIAEHQVVIDAGPVGRVRLYVERKTARRGKYSHCYWSDYRAEAVGAG